MELRTKYVRPFIGVGSVGWMLKSSSEYGSLSQSGRWRSGVLVDDLGCRRGECRDRNMDEREEQEEIPGLHRF